MRFNSNYDGNRLPLGRMLGRIFLFLALFLLLFVGNGMAAARFAVSPGVLKFDLTNVKTQTFIVMNTGKERVRLIVKPIYFELNSRFLAAGDPLPGNEDKQDDLTPYLVVSPRVVSLKPGQKRTIRVSVNPISNPLPGDYRAHLLVKTLKQDQKKDSDANQGISIQLGVDMETALAVYARNGEGEIPLEATCAKTAEGKLELAISNKSPWRFSGWMELGDPSGKTPPLMVRLVSLRQSLRKFYLNPPFPPSLTVKWGRSQKDLTLGQANCDMPTP